MIIVFDIGNTNITFGAFEGKELLFTSRMKTEPGRMEDQYAVEIKHILSLYGVGREYEGGVICSVVPALTDVLSRAVKQSFGITPLVVGPGIRTGLNIRIDNPTQLGADFVASAVAVQAETDQPAIIFDLGTATKASVLDRSGNLVGGLIMPGVGISLDALSSRTAQLPHIDLKKPATVIGTNTVDCMRSGVVNGTAAMVDGLTEMIEAELGYPCRLYLTGGLSEMIASCCKREYLHRPNLILDGLRVLYEKNRA